LTKNPKDSETSEEAVKALVRELGEVQKERRPLEASSFDGKAHILTSPAVQRLAGARATEVQRAECASKALLTAIEELSDEKALRIARAMFAVPEVYQGKTVTKRKEKLDELERIAPSTWDSRRKPILKKLAFALRLGSLPSSLGERDQYPRAQPAVDDSGLTNLAQTAALLHYAGLTTLFVADFDRQLVESPYYLGQDRTPTAEFLFHAYVGFAYGLAIGSKTSEKRILMSPRVLETSLGERLPLEIATQLARLWQSTRDTSPISPPSIDSADLARFLFLGETLYTTGIPPNMASLGADGLVGVTVDTGPGQKMVRMSPAPDTYRDWADTHYYKTWCKWVATSLFLRKYIAGPTDIETMTGLSGAFGAVLGKHHEIARPVHSRARTIACKMLTTYYSFDEWHPVVKERTLREHADTFFDTHSLLLVQKYIS
jgi:hypothetical protein